MADSVLHIFVFRDGAYVGSEVFLEPELVVGNGDGADLCLEDPNIGDAHAILGREAGRIHILDLGHPGGTRVNGTPIHHAWVGPRDEIALGRHLLKLKLVRPKRLDEGSSLRPESQDAPPERPGDRAEVSGLPEGASLRPEGVNLGSVPASPGLGRAPQQVPPRRPERASPTVPSPTADLVIGDMPSPPPRWARQEAIVPTHVVRERQPADDLDALIREALSEDDQAGVAELTTRLSELAPLDLQQVEANPELGPPIPSRSARALLEGEHGDRAFGTVDEALASAFGAEPSPHEAEALALGASAGLPSDDAVAEPTDELHTEATSLEQLGARPSPFSESFLGEVTEATPLRRAPLDDPLGTSAGEAEAPSLPPFIDAPRGRDAEIHAPAEALGPDGRALVGDLFGLEGDEDDEDLLDPDELEAVEPPGFSLREELLRTGQARGSSAPALEIITFDRGGSVSRVDLLEPGKQGRERFLVRDRTSRGSARRSVQLARLLGPGDAEVRFPTDAAGVLIESGHQIPLDHFKVPENAVSKRGEHYALRLRATQTLTFGTGTSDHHLRFVSPPALPPPPKAGLGWSGPIPRALGTSVMVHLIVALGVGLSTPAITFSESAREVWAEIEPDEIRPVEVPEPEPPPPAPEPPPERERRPPPPPPKKRAPPADAARVAPEPRAPAPSPASTPKRTEPKGRSAPQVKGVLGAMGALAQTSPGKRSMLAAVSNLDAVQAPGGSSYRVGALIGKAPDSEVRLGGGGGGKPLTRGSTDLLRGDGFARIGKASGAKVRGKVGKVVARRVETKGSISREEVAAVINRELGKIQSCYEKAQFANPDLRGKITVEWTIELDGRVSGVKQKFSTLQGPEVASCILALFKRLRFPAPRGGVVVASYPFTFAPISY